MPIIVVDSMQKFVDSRGNVSAEFYCFFII